MDDYDIYSDLTSFQLEDSAKYIKSEKEKDQEDQIKSLEIELNVIKDKLNSELNLKKQLATNFSSLLKTAKAEISRKDKLINDLRTKLEDLRFRRDKRNKESNIHRSLHNNHISADIDQYQGFCQFDQPPPLYNVTHAEELSAHVNQALPHNKDSKPPSILSLDIKRPSSFLNTQIGIKSELSEEYKTTSLLNPPYLSQNEPSPESDEMVEETKFSEYTKKSRPCDNNEESDDDGVVNKPVYVSTVYGERLRKKLQAEKEKELKKKEEKRAQDIETKNQDLKQSINDNDKSLAKGEDKEKISIASSKKQNVQINQKNTECKDGSNLNGQLLDTVPHFNKNYSSERNIDKRDFKNHSNSSSSKKSQICNGQQDWNHEKKKNQNEEIKEKIIKNEIRLHHSEKNQSEYSRDRNVKNTSNSISKDNIHIDLPKEDVINKVDNSISKTHYSDNLLSEKYRSNKDNKHCLSKDYKDDNHKNIFDHSKYKRDQQEKYLKNKFPHVQSTINSKKTDHNEMNVNERHNKPHPNLSSRDCKNRENESERSNCLHEKSDQKPVIKSDCQRVDNKIDSVKKQSIEISQSVSSQDDSKKVDNNHLSDKHTVNSHHNGFYPSEKNETKSGTKQSSRDRNNDNYNFESHNHNQNHNSYETKDKEQVKSKCQIVKSKVVSKSNTDSVLSSKDSNKVSNVCASGNQSHSHSKDADLSNHHNGKNIIKIRSRSSSRGSRNRQFKDNDKHRTDRSRDLKYEEKNYRRSRRDNYDKHDKISRHERSRSRRRSKEEKKRDHRDLKKEKRKHKDKSLTPKKEKKERRRSKEKKKKKDKTPCKEHKKHREERNILRSSERDKQHSDGKNLKRKLKPDNDSTDDSTAKKQKTDSAVITLPDKMLSSEVETSTFESTQKTANIENIEKQSFKKENKVENLPIDNINQDDFSLEEGEIVDSPIKNLYRPETTIKNGQIIFANEKVLAEKLDPLKCISDIQCSNIPVTSGVEKVFESEKSIELATNIPAVDYADEKIMDNKQSPKPDVKQSCKQMDVENETIHNSGLNTYPNLETLNSAPKVLNKDGVKKIMDDKLLTKPVKQPHEHVDIENETTHNSGPNTYLNEKVLNTCEVLSNSTIEKTMEHKQLLKPVVQSFEQMNETIHNSVTKTYLNLKMINSVISPLKVGNCEITSTPKKLLSVHDEKVTIKMTPIKSVESVANEIKSILSSMNSTENNLPSINTTTMFNQEKITNINNSKLDKECSSNLDSPIKKKKTSSTPTKKAIDKKDKQLIKTPIEKGSVNQITPVVSNSNCKNEDLLSQMNQKSKDNFSSDKVLVASQKHNNCKLEEKVNSKSAYSKPSDSYESSEAKAMLKGQNISKEKLISDCINANECSDVKINLSKDNVISNEDKQFVKSLKNTPMCLQPRIYVKPRSKNIIIVKRRKRPIVLSDSPPAVVLKNTKNLNQAR